jgi:hypothetical protein
MELSKEALEAAQEVEKKKKAAIFIAEYQELCKKHGMGLQAIAQWSVVEILEPKQEVKEEEPAITAEVKDGEILDK